LKSWVAWLSAIAAAFAACSAQAATVTCSGDVTSSPRSFTLTIAGDIAPSCWDWDAGNIPTKTHGRNQDIFEVASGPAPHWDGKLQVPTGFSRLDDSADADDPFEGMLVGSGDLRSGLSGTFSIDGSAAAQYLLIFKTGVASRDPDWMAFLLPQGVLSGSWSISGQHSLSHAQVWGDADDQSVPQVPIPAAAWLLGSGLMGLLAFARRRRSA
jgi:hypothetical protein